MRSKAEQVLEIPEASVLDVIDHVLTKGVLASGDVTLGVAGIDLIYLRLSAILCAADRVLPPGDPMLESRRRRVRLKPDATRGRRKADPAASRRRKKTRR
jgi:Gas vesicle protein